MMVNLPSVATERMVTLLVARETMVKLPFGSQGNVGEASFW